MISLKDIKIGTRMGTGFALVLLIFLGAITVSTLVLNAVDNGTKRVKNATLPSLMYSYEMDVSAVGASEIITDISATHNLDGFKEAENIVVNFKENAAKLKEIYKNQHDMSGIAIVEETESAFNNFYEDGKRMANIYISQGKDAGNRAMQVFDKTRGKLTESIERLQKKAVEAADKDSLNNIKNVGNVQRLLIIAGGFAIITGAFIAVFITHSIRRPIKKAVEVSNKLAEGDLTVVFEINSKDEAGQLLASMKNMAGRLKEVVVNVKSSSDNIASASQELSASSEQMSRGVTEQASRASQIAAASTEMSQTIIDVAKNSSNIATSATDTLKVADNGKGIVNRSVEEVKAIAETVEESARIVSSLGEKSKQIGEIVNVIKDIADQTNLLALNAAIEAARAGEQGRGFAVVADEVRKLAERTAKATSEISQMIGGIRSEMENAVISMGNGTRRVESGVEFSTQAGEALKKIVLSVSELQTMVQQIATATEEMSTVSEQISGDIDTIANVSKETSESSNQVSQASSDLARLASNLQNVVSMFKI